MLGIRTNPTPLEQLTTGPFFRRGCPFLRSPDYAPKSDTDLHAWVLDHVFDLDTQNEAAITTTLMGYANHYESVNSYATQVGYAKPYDMTIVVGNTGVRFKPMPASQQGWTLRPHLLLGCHGQRKILFQYGRLGLGTEYRLSERLAYGGTYENSRQVYFARDDMTNAPALGGSRQYLRANATLETGANRFLLTEIGFQDYDGNIASSGYRGAELRFLTCWAILASISICAAMGHHIQRKRSAA